MKDAKAKFKRRTLHAPNINSSKLEIKKKSAFGFKRGI